MRADLEPMNHRASGLVDVLDRVLDKGLAIAGDIKVSLAAVELLTIRIRLIVCSIDKAQEIGLDWWKHDGYLTPDARPTPDTRDLREQLNRLERRVAALGERRRSRLAPTRLARRKTPTRSRR